MCMTERHMKELTELLARQAAEAFQAQEEEVPAHRKEGWLEGQTYFKELRDAILYMDKKIQELEDHLDDVSCEVANLMDQHDSR